MITVELEIVYDSGKIEGKEERHKSLKRFYIQVAL